MQTLAPLLAELFFYLALPIVAIYSLIFGYHWFNFGTQKSHASLAMIIFLVGAGLLLGVMFLTLQYVG